MSGCREADEKTKEETIDVFTKLNSAPFSQTVFPEWLTGKINEIEVTDGIKNRTFSNWALVYEYPDNDYY